MTEHTLSGEDRLRSKTRRKWTIIGIIFVVGAIVGFIAARMEDVRGYDFSGPWPPEVALGILAAFLITMSIGTFFMNRELDDYEKDIQRRAAAFAGGAILLGYPIWFLLWKASLVVEPIHWVIFLGGYAAMYAALAYYKFR